MRKLQEENSNAANISQSDFEMKCRDYEHVRPLSLLALPHHPSLAY
jgi:hypothetical protein